MFLQIAAQRKHYETLNDLQKWLKFGKKKDSDFKDGFICNAYFNNKIIGSVGAMPSEWWFSNNKFLANMVLCFAQA